MPLWNLTEILVYCIIYFLIWYWTWLTDILKMSMYFCQGYWCVFYLFSPLVLVSGLSWPHRMNFKRFPPFKFFTVVWGLCLFLLSSLTKIQHCIHFPLGYLYWKTFYYIVNCITFNWYVPQIDFLMILVFSNMLA